MIIISNLEIEEYTRDIFRDNGKQISTKHNVFNGEKDFTLCIIEQTLGLLKREKIDDERIIYYLQGLMQLSKDSNNHYEWFLKNIIQDKTMQEIGMKNSNYNKLSKEEKRVLNEMMMSNIGEYLMKGEYQSCCYSAMITFFIATYCILLKNISCNVGKIELIVDIYDELEAINIYESEEEVSNIYIQWQSTNKINGIYMLYKTQYIGLDNSSILDLVAADVIEEDYFLKDDRFTIAPSILVKQYCSIIEHEVNQIIQLLNYEDKPNKHLMWNDMKIYVKKHGIKLQYTSMILKDVLNKLHGLRNKASHGEIITNEEYEIIRRYRNENLFGAISATKLMLRGKKISPTIDEIREYLNN